MGIDMEIDQIAGFLKPKTDKAELAGAEQTALADPLPEGEGFLAMLEFSPNSDSDQPPTLSGPTPQRASAPSFAGQTFQQDLIQPGFADLPEISAPSPEAAPTLTAEETTVPVQAETPALVPPTPPAPMAPALLPLTTAPIAAAPAEAALAQPGKAAIIAANAVFPAAGAIPAADSKPVIKDAEVQKTAAQVEKAEITAPKTAAPLLAKQPDAAPVQAPIIAAPKEPQPKLEAPVADRQAAPVKQAETSNKPVAPQPAPVGFATAPSLPPLFDPTLAETGDAELQVNIRVERQAFETLAITQQSQRATAPLAAQIASQIQSQITQKTQQVIELRLDPPELGRVVIQLSANDQVVIAQISADRPETIDLMRRHAELLASTLEKAGFAQANLSFQQGTPQQDKHEFGEASLSLTNEPEDAIMQTTPLPIIDGRLDIRL